LFLLGGADLREIHDTLPEAVPEPAVTSPATVYTEYDKAIIRLNAHFNPKRNTMVETFKFHEAKQTSDEKLVHYVSRLKILAKFCEFPDTDHAIVHQVVHQCYSSNMRRTFLKQKKLTLTTLLELGELHDALDVNIEIVEGKRTANHEAGDQINKIC
jgi:hypothetical protein